jgi:hypothetical protein
MAQSKWFKRLRSDCKRLSPHIRFKRIRMGFWRIYYNRAYLHEVYEDMSMKGYDIVSYNPRLENQSYYEEYEDSIDTIRNVKNYVEGYYDSSDRIKTRLWMHRHDKEFNQESDQAFQQIVVK